MNIQEYENIFENEEIHFFYLSNHKIILSLIKKYLWPNKKIKILDAGCGTGLLTKKLNIFGDTIGLDYNEEALKFAKKRKIKVKKGSVTNIPFGNNTFDLVTCIDVINHRWVKSDLLGMREFYRVLRPGGILIIRVSANPWLKLRHDKHVYLKERYSRRIFREKLKKAGFKLEKVSYTNAILLPIATIRMLLEKINKKHKVESGISPLPYLVNNILTLLLSWEAWSLKYFNLPFGIALIAVCKKEA